MVTTTTASPSTATKAAATSSPSTNAPSTTKSTIDSLTANLDATHLANDAGTAASRHLDAAALRSILLGTTARHGGGGANDASRAADDHQRPGSSVDDGHAGDGDTQAHDDDVGGGGGGEGGVRGGDGDGDAPLAALTAFLNERIWADGGETVLHIGGPARDASFVAFTADQVARAVDNVRRVCKHLDCEAVVLHRSGTAIGTGTDGEEGVAAREGGATPRHEDPAAASKNTARHDDGGFSRAVPSPNAYVLLRRVATSAQEILELRIAVIGNVDAGKSSTLGVLTKGTLDDGRGKARVNLFRHKHEIESGRTSSVGMEMMGFDASGGVVMNRVEGEKGEAPPRKMSWEEVCARASKVISFIDLAGHERYLKTTVSGLTGCLPDFAILMVGANAGLIGMSKEHLGVALALSLPVIVCITKVDMTPKHVLETTIKQLTKILRSPGCRKTPVFIEEQGQMIEAALRLGTERICPIFQISNVTGHNLPLLRSFLNVLPQTNASKFSPSAPFKFQLQDVFSVPFTGTVVSGVILSGVVRIGDNLLIGPDSLGQFTSTSVRSIQRKRVTVDSATAGQSASFALRKIRRNQVRKGMVMLAKTDVPPKAHMTCDAEILCLYHSTTLSVGSCMVLHAASIRQTVRIIAIAKLDANGRAISPASTTRTRGKHDASGATAGAGSNERPVVRTGDRAILRLQFLRFAEYIEPGARLITREGKTKLIGVIRHVGCTGPLLTPSGEVVPGEAPSASDRRQQQQQDRNSNNSNNNGGSSSSSAAVSSKPPPASATAAASA